MNSNSDITLHYFTGNGRDFVLRFMLTMAKVKFNNNMYTMDEWAKLDKPIETFGF